MADSLFQTTTPDNEVAIDETKEYFPELVGEGKRYKTPEELARKAVHADAHITRIEQENAQLRQRADQGLTLQEFLDKLATQNNTTANPTTTANQSEEQVESAQTLTKETVASLVKDYISSMQQETVESTNLRRVGEVLSQVFGPAYTNVVREKAKQLGITEKTIDTLAKEQPNAVFALLGVDLNKTREAPSNTNSIRSDSSVFKGNGKNFNHFEEIRKKSPTLYWTKEVQADLYNQLSAQGPEKFYSN